MVGSDPGLAIALTLVQASVLLLRGEVNEARVMLHEVGRRIPPLLAVLRDGMLADLDTALGRPRAALRLLRDYRNTEFSVLTEMARARAFLALNELRNAQDCVRSVLATPSTQSGRFSLVEAMLYDAQIAQLSGDPGRAIEVLVRALEVARGDIILPFVQVKNTFAELLARHPNVAAQWPVRDPRMSAGPAGPRPPSPRRRPPRSCPSRSPSVS